MRMACEMTNEDTAQGGDRRAGHVRDCFTKLNYMEWPAFLCPAVQIVLDLTSNERMLCSVVTDYTAPREQGLQE